jgi:hypothetical protein
MRPLFAALLLLLQLQPVLGAAVCLGLVQQPTQASCDMPEHGSVPAQHYSESGPDTPENCAIASFCTPAPLAVPGFANLLETTSLPTSTLPISGHGQLPDVYTAPPFHPPKA